VFRSPLSSIKFRNGRAGRSCGCKCCATLDSARRCIQVLSAGAGYSEYSQGHYEYSQGYYEYSQGQFEYSQGRRYVKALSADVGWWLRTFSVVIIAVSWWAPLEYLRVPPSTTEYRRVR
jgi:hypothetical protein